MGKVAQRHQFLHQGDVLIGILADGHILLEGVPGLAKTLLIKTVSEAIQAEFSRIQFTPDLMPSDITGYELLGKSEQDSSHTMTFRPGPVFTQLLLADEGVEGRGS